MLQFNPFQHTSKGCFEIKKQFYASEVYIFVKIMYLGVFKDKIKL